MSVLNWAVERISVLSDLVAKDMAFIWVLPKSNELDENNAAALKKFKEIFESKAEIASDEINSLCRNFCEENSIKYGTFMKLMRSVLTGLQVRLKVT